MNADDLRQSTSRALAIEKAAEAGQCDQAIALALALARQDVPALVADHGYLTRRTERLGARVRALERQAEELCQQVTTLTGENATLRAQVAQGDTSRFAAGDNRG